MSTMQRLLHSRRLVLSTAWAMTVGIGVLDYFTGREIQVVALYLVPVSVVVWSAGRGWGIACAFFAAVTWLASELGSGDLNALHLGPLWNALMFLAVFLLVALLLSALRDMMISLERRVRTRTAQLHEEMTRRHDAELATLRAERLAQVGTMAAQVAHEVRNPMGAVALNLDMLAGELVDMKRNPLHPSDEASVLVDQIRQEIGRVEQVLKDYLEFAKLPKVVPQMSPLNAFLEDKLAVLMPELAASSIRLIRDFDPRIQKVGLDPVQMWQVILNLVLNARDAMPEGGELRVRTLLKEDTLEISVADSGCGIKPEDVSRLFTPFFTTKARGTGLGLALCQQIVNEHHGRILCESRVGEGTTFRILLPPPATYDVPSFPAAHSSEPLLLSSHERHPSPTY